VKELPASGHLPTLSFIGAGRAGAALARAAHAAGFGVAAVSSRDHAAAELLARDVGARAVRSPAEAMLAADVTFLAAPDNAITPVAATIASSGASLQHRAAVHLSARLGPEALAALRLTGADIAVLHPLQALAGPESAALLLGAYFRIEATGRTRDQLLSLVTALGGYEIAIPADRRALYHAAAVLAGNAPLALLARATSLLEQAGVDAETAHAALATLLAGAASNAKQRGPARALTGPVVRGDSDAVSAHLKALEPYPEIRDLYARLALEMASLAGRSLDVAARDTAAGVAGERRQDPSGRITKVA
jgi:predicted short-subunit dehydrogenase-like oxidoreductase (DUF2520 family)